MFQQCYGIWTSNVEDLVLGRAALIQVVDSPHWYLVQQHFGKGAPTVNLSALHMAKDVQGTVEGRLPPRCAGHIANADKYGTESGCHLRLEIANEY